MKLVPVRNKIAKFIYLTFGTVFLILGLAGILLPFIPGWLFLIPALFCFAKSSIVFNGWLKRRKSFQKYF